jgi:hypothetical protein
MAEKMEIRVTQKGVDKVKKDFFSLKSSMDRAEDSTQKMNKSIGAMRIQTAGLRRSIGAFRNELLLVTFATAGFAAAISKLKNESEKLSVASNAMSNQFNQSAIVFNARLKEMSDGTVSSYDLIMASNRAMALNVTTDLDKISKLLQFARLRARAMGITTTQAFNDIATGIGRASPLILDNLGIITKGWAEEAKAVGESYNAQFILNKVLSQADLALSSSGEMLLSNADKTQRFKAAISDLTAAIGDRLVDSVGNATESITNAIIQWTETLNLHKTEVELTSKAYENLSNVAKASLIELRIEELENKKQTIEHKTILRDFAQSFVYWGNAINNFFNALTTGLDTILSPLHQVTGFMEDTVESTGMIPVDFFKKLFSPQYVNTKELTAVNNEIDKLFNSLLQINILGDDVALALNIPDVDEEIAASAKRATEAIYDLIHDTRETFKEPILTEDKTSFDLFAESVEETNDEIEKSTKLTWLNIQDDIDKILGEFEKKQQQIQARWNAWAGMFSDVFYEAFGGSFDSIEDYFNNMLKRMAADLAASALTNLLNPAAGGVGMFGAQGLFGFLGFKNGGNVTNRGGRPIKAQSGYSGIVPPGFPNDSFPIMVQSGEHVNVTSSGNTRNGFDGVITAINDLKRITARKPVANTQVIGDASLYRTVKNGQKRSGSLWN